MHRLLNDAQNYAWGSRGDIPQFLGATADSTPVAEVWIGTHPLLPSTAVDADGTDVPLTEVAGELPFLVKLLAAGQPLSLQVHPSLEQAREGYAREEAAGVPRSAGERVYKDANHKPEMAYALSTFETLVGFRPTNEILRVLGPIGTPLTKRLFRDLRDDPGFDGIVRRVRWLLEEGVEPREVQAVVASCAELAEGGLDIRRAYSTVAELAEYYPDDVGVVISLLLNRMTLQPGEAAFLATGVIHAHLKGLCIEVMATSDNVLRAGLTSKHIDAEGLVECLDAGMARIARVTPEYLDATELFSPGDVEFALAVTQVSHADTDGVSLRPEQQSILLCTGGEVEVCNAVGERQTLVRGESLYAGPEDGVLQMSGLGEVAQAFAPAGTYDPRP